ncbi:hypothetical protein KP509_01G092800 [Ceratopteris richardii]|uniref:ABC transporter domain-containing protein n=1 Tax=Ceratopteris richardii TaxID=49495 RepID=A0A8T2VF91_CERRI|nr:hypothetical protein KP509_01G092800 [Ceratopteris richardii]
MKEIVKFKSIEYYADVFITDEAYETVLTKWIQAAGLFRHISHKKKGPRRQRMLNDVTGYLMPGTLTVVLGPPASGKSALNYILSGNLHSGASVQGSVTYNNVPLQNIKTHHLAAVVAQKNDHIPHLTVRETLEFAKKCLSPFNPQDYGTQLKNILGDVLSKGQDPKVELIMSMMGLKHVANRIVGNALIPSITEDERYRLSAAEMCSGSHAVYFFDQLSTDAEDSVAFELLTAMRIYTRVRQITFLASLSQPSSEVFNLFDRVIVLNDGKLVYQGPREDVLTYFEKLGYKKPKHLSAGEFLQEVTTPDGSIYLQPGFRRLSVEDFVIAYKSSNLYNDVLRIVNGPELVQELWVQGDPPLGVEFQEYSYHKDNETTTYVVSGVKEEDGSLLGASMDHTMGVQKGDKVVAFAKNTDSLKYFHSSPSPRMLQDELSSAISSNTGPVRLQLERNFEEVKDVSSNQLSKDYMLSVREEVLLLTKREIHSIWGNQFGLKLRAMQVLVMSLFLGFLLFRIDNRPDQRYMNLFRSGFFVSVINMTMFNVGQLPALMSERYIYYKQKGAHFYRPISFLLGKIIGGLPFTLCETTVWSILVYFLTNMTTSDGGWHFFVYYAVIVLTALNGSSMVRFLGFSVTNLDKAGMLIGIMVTLFILFAGFLIPRLQVPKYWIWVFYLNPLQWAITALVINEYNSGAYSLLCRDIPNLALLPQCNGRGDQTIGHAYLARGQFFISRVWIVISILMLLAWVVVWNLLTYFALKTIQHHRILRTTKYQNVISSEDIRMKDIEHASKHLTHTPIPVTLSWHELSYDIMIPGSNKRPTILKVDSGWGEPCDMVAILGDAEGKTALLNCLAGRKILNENIEGQILVNGYPKVQKSFRHIMGYVDKIEAYAPYLTVHETVAYSAALRLQQSSSKDMQAQFVKEVLELTELAHLQNTLVASLINDVTFDQERRLAIATELVANPSVLFLENPTKSLDSSSANNIVKCLQQIANSGRIVIMTMNYPSQRILSMLTRVKILKGGGQTVYFGPVGANGDLIRTYFETIPGTPLCPPNKSVSAYAIDLIGDNPFRKSEKDYAFEYQASELALKNHIHLQQLRKPGRNGEEVKIHRYEASFWRVFLETIISVQHQYWRNVNYSLGRVFAFLITAVILGSVFYNLDMTTTAGLNSLSGAIFISCVLVGITNAQNAIPQVIQLRAVHLRERAVHQSSVLIYNIADILAEIPYLMVSNLLFCGIFLSMTQIANGSASDVFKYWFISLEFYATITFLGSFLAVVSPKPVVASVLVPIIVGIWISTAGLTVPRSMITDTFIWVFWTNPLQYALDGLTSIAFYCDLDKPLCLDSNRNPQCEKNPAACPSCDCPRMSDTGNNIFVWRQVSNIRSLNYSRIHYDMIALLLFAILFRILTLLAFRFTRHYKRT